MAEKNKRSVNTTKGIDIRVMSYKQIKALRKAGLDPAYFGVDGAKSSEMVDYILENIYPEYDFDSCGYDEIFELGMATYRRCFGAPEETKN